MLHIADNGGCEFAGLHFLCTVHLTGKVVGDNLLISVFS